MKVCCGLFYTFIHGFLGLLGCKKPGTENNIGKNRATTTNAIRTIAASRPVNASWEFFRLNMGPPVLLSCE